MLVLSTGILFISAGFVLQLNSKNPLASQFIPKEFNASTQVLFKEVVVARVLDGDTIQTSAGEKIRYIGINAPEKGEMLFEEALKLNESLTLNKTIRLEFDSQSLDRYGRILAYVFSNDKLINLEMVRLGLATIQTIQPNVKYQDAIIAAQKEAREKCLGVWKSLCQNYSHFTP